MYFLISFVRMRTLGGFFPSDYGRCNDSGLKQSNPQNWPRFNVPIRSEFLNKARSKRVEGSVDSFSYKTYD